MRRCYHDNTWLPLPCAGAIDVGMEDGADIDEDIQKLKVLSLARA
jgi:hypothetical protein